MWAEQQFQRKDANFSHFSWTGFGRLTFSAGSGQFVLLFLHPYLVPSSSKESPLDLFKHVKVIHDILFPKDRTIIPLQILEERMVAVINFKFKLLIERKTEEIICLSMPLTKP